MFCKWYPLVVHYISFSINFTKARLSHCKCDFDQREDLRERPEAKDHFLASSLSFWSKSSPSSEISIQNVLIGSNILLPSFPYLQVRSTKLFCQNISFFALLIRWCISLPLMSDSSFTAFPSPKLLYIYNLFHFCLPFLIYCCILLPQPIFLFIYVLFIPFLFVSNLLLHSSSTAHHIYTFYLFCLFLISISSPTAHLSPKLPLASAQEPALLLEVKYNINI